MMISSVLRATSMAWGLFMLMLMITPLCAAAEDTTQPQWSVRQGWLSAEESGEALLGQGPGAAADIRLGDDDWLLEDHPAQTQLSPLNVNHPEAGWQVIYTTAEGVLIDRIEPFAKLGPDAWRRTLTYTNHSQARQDLTAARLRVAPHRREGALNWQPEHFWMGEASATRAVCVSYQGTTDYYHFSDGKQWVETMVEAAWRLEPGETATIGRQGVWLGAAGREPFRAEAQRWYQAIGLRVPTETLPEWARTMILYEAAASGHIDSRFSDVGGFDAFSHQLDALADLGVSTIWYNSVFKHKTPPNPMKGGWNHYDPLSFKEVDAILGGMDGFKRLADATKARQIHVIGEIIPWGGHSPEAQALPQWWLRDQEGKPVTPWGSVNMDYSSPEWQQVMHDGLALLAQQAGIEGARIDVADGNGLNWGSPRTHQASYSTLAGSCEMLKAMHAGLATAGGQPVVIPETIVNRPEHLALPGIIAYGFPQIFFLEALGKEDLSDAARLNERLREFFETERGDLPEGSLVIRTLNNHDTVCEAGRVQQRFGTGLSRALWGVCLSVPGVPMLYQEEETGSQEALRAMNWGRRRVPELAGGRADYLSIKAAPEVFSVLRQTGDGAALALVNLSGKTVNGAIALPTGLNLAAPRTWDAVSGREAPITEGHLAWTLAPYETALLRLGQPPVGEVPARRHLGEAPVATLTPTPAPRAEARPAGLSLQVGGLDLALKGGAQPWTVAAQTDAVTTLTTQDGHLSLRHEGDDYKIDLVLGAAAAQAGAPTLVIQNAAQWFVSGRTALLHDYTLRRHFPFPPASDYRWDRTIVWGAAPGSGILYNNVAPDGRLWQSLLEPLHPARPGLGFVGTDGQGVTLTDVATTAGNLVLTDATDEAGADPWHLELRAYGADPDLHPRVRVYGLGQPWVMDRDLTPPASNEPVRLAFTLRPAPAAAVETALSAERLPIEDQRAHRQSSGKVSPYQDVTLMQTPGTLTWTNLAPVPGVPWRIGLELRHSEKSASGTDLAKAYRVTVDGQEQPLEWTQLDSRHFGNAWMGWAFTPAINLAQGRHTITLEAAQPWCAAGGSFKLAPAAR